MDFSLSGVHTWTYETKGSYPYYTAKIDQLMSNKVALRTSCKCRSALIPKLRSKKPSCSSGEGGEVERKGKRGGREREAEREGEGDGEREGERESERV